MQRLEVSGAVRNIYGSLGIKRLRNVMSIEDSIFNPFLQEWERGALLGKARRYRVRPSDRLLNPRRSPSYVLSPYRTSGCAWELFCEVRMCHEGWGGTS